MKNRKKIVIISTICIFAFALTTIGIYFCIDATAPKTFSTAKKECVKVLDKHQAEMEQIAVAITLIVM